MARRSFNLQKRCSVLNYLISQKGQDKKGNNQFLGVLKPADYRQPPRGVLKQRVEVFHVPGYAECIPAVRNDQASKNLAANPQEHSSPDGTLEGPGSL